MNILKLDYVGNHSGGVYDKLDVNGVATINGDISAEIIDNDGVSTLLGNLDCKDFSCNGVCTVHGNVSAEKMKINGIITCLSNLRSNDFTCDGTAKVNGNMRCETLQSSGLLTVNGEKFEGSSLRGDGFISAKSAQISADDIYFEGKITADEIVGERVTILSRSKHIPFINFSSNANLIEATTIEISGVTAKIVSGETIRLLNDCKIGTVDCNGTLYIGSSCTVGNITGNYTIA